MKGIGYNRKNLIALALAGILMGCILFSSKSWATERIEDTRPITITAIADPSSVLGKEYQGEITVDMYKIAAFDTKGKLTITDGFKSDKEGEKISFAAMADEGADVDKLTDNVKSSIVDPAVAIVKSTSKAPDETFTVKRENGKLTGTKAVSSGIGLYLYIPREAKDELHTYTFTPFVVSLPTSNALSKSTKVDANGNVVEVDDASEAWNYDVTISLKSDVTSRPASLEIIKTLKTYNKSLGTAGCVFEVNAYNSENQLVFSNVYPINFTAAGTQSILIKDRIPAGSYVEIKEAYSGSSYSIDGLTQDKNSAVIESLPADEITQVKFNNDYDNRIIEGTIAVENHFVKVQDGDNVSYKWESNNLSQDTTNTEN